MNKLRLRPRLAALLTTSIACLCLLALSSAPAWAKAGTIKEFPTPTANSTPGGITAGSDGNLWFTEFNGNNIGRIIRRNGKITEFPIPTANSAPVGITAGPDGNLWFTEINGNKIGRITTAGVITEFPIPTGNSEPLGITAGPAHTGYVWFTEVSTNNIGRISTQ